MLLTAGALLLVGHTNGQTAQLQVNGDGVGPVGVSIGETVVLDLIGPASQPFALAIGMEPANIGTPFGQLGLDPWASTSFIFLDGMNPAHPYHGLSFLSVTGQFTMFTIPFQSGSAGVSFWSQSLVLDPASPEGAVLTNDLQVTSVQPAPEVGAASPNYNAAGGPLYITGSYFDSNPANNTVRIGDQVCTVLNAANDWLFVELPSDARSGPISVTTASGTGGGDKENIDTWCAIATTPYTEGQQPAIIDTKTTVLGEIPAPGETDYYTMLVEAGEELVVELYSWDNNAQSITGTVNSTNIFFDGTLRVFRHGVPVAMDDDSGPHLNAAIGLDHGITHFVADETGEYVIEVDAFMGFGTGYYLLVMETRTPRPAPLRVISLHPNVAPPGAVIHAYMSGVTGGDPSQYSLTVGGEPVEVTNAIPGRLDFVVPPTGTLASGVVNVSTATESTPHTGDSIEAWLCLISSPLQAEATLGGNLQPGQSLYGQLSVGSEVDSFMFDGEAGKQYSIEVSCFDDASARVITAEYLLPGTLDPEVRVLDAGTPLISDGAGGPGLNAMIGGTLTGLFTAPSTQAYEIRISSLFAISSGSYILNVREVPGL